MCMQLCIFMYVCAYVHIYIKNRSKVIMLYIYFINFTGLFGSPAAVIVGPHVSIGDLFFLPSPLCTLIPC